MSLDEGLKLRTIISKQFWPKLSRELTQEKAGEAAQDSKSAPNARPVIFLPDSESKVQHDYYARDPRIVIKQLPSPSQFTDDFIFGASREAGILGLAFENDEKPMHYVVPGGRFNEFYGWDSYFVALGLLEDGYVDLAANVASQFAFEIENYGKVLNANRPYYLGRTQPPFLTDLAWRLHGEQTVEHQQFVAWIKAAILEYRTVWRAPPRYDPGTGLSKYLAQGRGIPPEVEHGHFDSVIRPFAEKHHLSPEEFVAKYNAQQLKEPELDTFLLHDRALRESGHDVTSRFVGVCADLATVDLNSLLYKYEVDIARAVEAYPQEFPGEDSSKWSTLAQNRVTAVDKYLWDAKDGCYRDYNVSTASPHKWGALSATSIWPLWSGMASAEQAKSFISGSLPLLEFAGGISSTSEVPDNGRQWDFPAGWAPHQILAWHGLRQYGFEEDASRLANKWVQTILQGAKQSGGAVFEKYDITGVENPHQVRAEYGNQGSSETGFGWSNASFIIAWDNYVAK